MSDPTFSNDDNELSVPSRDLGQRWFGGLIPDLEARSGDFETDLNVLDEELLQLFYEQIVVSVEEVRQGIGAADAKQIRESAHSLQGMGGVVGAPEISVLGVAFSEAAIAEDWCRCGELLTALEGWQGEWRPMEAGTGVPVEKMPALKGRILVVDDELPNRRFLEKLLKDCGAEVLLAENGEEALQLIARHQPDVALVDVVMPGISGYEVCERVTGTRELSQTMVIMVTAKSNVADIEHAFLKGAFDYIRKPFQSRELMARVRNALLLKKNTEALKSWNLRVSRDLETAGTVQAMLFDPTPVFARHYDFRVGYRSSQHIGGDMFDLHRLADGRLLFYVADVAGHGVGSALITTLIKGLISEVLSALGNPDLYEIGNELHRRYRLCVADPELYATMILVRMDPETGQVETLSCGHPPPLVFGENGKVLPGFVEEKGGMPVGMMPAEFGLPYLKEDEVHVCLPASATMYMYTDGLIEAKTGDGRECGEAGLVACIEQSVQDDKSLGDPDDILDGLLAEGYELTADDCTLMNLRRIPSEQVLACGERALSMEEVDGLSVELTEVLMQKGWEDLAVSMVRLLITEHLANVVKHGRCPQGKLLFYRLTLLPLGCVLVMSDPGIAWDPDHWRREKQKNPETFSEGGRGLGMIARICERQRHFRRDNYNHSVYTLHRNLAERLNEEFESEENQ